MKTLLFTPIRKWLLKILDQEKIVQCSVDVVTFYMLPPAGDAGSTLSIVGAARTPNQKY
ncbi:MAG: hypothetical protein KAU52_00725 [Methanosarcinales archaeon]|nr:hypothetical protein [Methanosarcinales archaeon]